MGDYKRAYRNYRTNYPEPYTIWITEESKRQMVRLRDDFAINVSARIRKVLERELERLTEEIVHGRR